MKNIFITGGGGYVGSALFDFLKTAKKYGFNTVHNFKKTIALKIKNYIDIF